MGRDPGRVEEESYAIAIIAMLASVIAAYLYLRIIVSAWLRIGPEDKQPEPVPPMTALAVGLAALFTLAIGVWPEWLLDLADHVNQYYR